MKRQYQLAELLPHGPAMTLLDQIVEINKDGAWCAVTIKRSMPFTDAEGNLPGWVGMELMAQAAAVWMAHQGKIENQVPRIGFLIKVNPFVANIPAIPCGRRVDVKVRLVMRIAELGQFEGRITCGDEVLATSVFSTYVPSTEQLESLFKSEHGSG